MSYTRPGIQGARSADDLELGALELPLPGAPEPLSGYTRGTVSPRRCPPGYVATSRGCVKPRTVNPIARALGALGLGGGCGCGGGCGGGMGDSPTPAPVSTPLSAGVEIGLVGLTGFLIWRALKKG